MEWTCAVSGFVPYSLVLLRSSFHSRGQSPEWTVHALRSHTDERETARGASSKLGLPVALGMLSRPVVLSLWAFGEGVGRVFSPQPFRPDLGASAALGGPTPAHVTVSEAVGGRPSQRTRPVLLRGAALSTSERGDQGGEHVV